MKESTEDYKPSIKGKIIYLHPKGWGFINSHDIEFSKVYFHWTGLITSGKNFKELQKGNIVKFNALKREKGWKAINIEVVDGEAKAG